MKGLKVDRERAIRAAAVAGLVVLALSVLPGLLRTPDPPELPSDVGFGPVEGTNSMVLPGRLRGPRTGHGADDRKDGRPGKGERLTNRMRSGRNSPRNSRKVPRNRVKQRRNAPKSADSAFRTAPPKTSPAPDEPTDFGPSPVPVPAPPPAAPPVAVQPPPPPTSPSPSPSPSPDPAPAPAPPPADGSQEFAPH